MTDLLKSMQVLVGLVFKFNQTRTRVHGLTGKSLNRSGTIDRSEKRLPMVSGHSESTGSDVGSSAGSGARGHDDRAKREPQDSETPWICTLVLSQLGVDGVVDGSDVTVGVVPFPLPDVYRQSAVDMEDVLVLTAEEIKDVVSSTGLWPVVRGNIDGVEKISQKGDGWRMRRNLFRGAGVAALACATSAEGEFAEVEYEYACDEGSHTARGLAQAPVSSRNSSSECTRSESGIWAELVPQTVVGD
ncbi:hypothetical protein BC827DRAFT_1385407 [Russula dissimulans]|nr:hypothetical protein BC827DRAFT_1385407 [Russula dissimulans]